MRLQYFLILFLICNVHATQYWPIKKQPVVVKIQTPAARNEDQTRKEREINNDHLPKPEAIIMEKTENDDDIGLRNRKKTNMCSHPRTIVAINEQPINRKQALGLFSLFSCSGPIEPE